MHRLTISLDDELYEAARLQSFEKRASLGQTIRDLLRQALKGPEAPPAERVDDDGTSYFDPVLGHRVNYGGPPITQEMIDAAMDEIHNEDFLKHAEILKQHQSS